ncbi:MAG: ABC transporter permease, partial [Acidobacteriota bacterium]
MRVTQILRKRLRSLFHRSQQDLELRDEIALHFEQLVKEHRAAGLSEKEARLAARREFGHDALLAEDSRRAWGWNWLEDAGKDVAFGMRLLAKSPGFTLTAVASLALGIGANTAIFGLVKQLILDTLPVRDPQTLVHVTRSTFDRASLPSFSFPFLTDLQKAEGTPFQGFLATAAGGQITMVTEEGAEPVYLTMVSGNYYELLGVQPALGRLFTADDDRVPGQHPVAVLSFNFWQRRFGRDPSVLNKSIRLDNREFTIVAVSAAGFDGMSPGQPADVHVPVTMAPFPVLDRGDWWLDVFGRLKPGVHAADAGALLLPLLLRNYALAGDVPRSDYQRRVRASERMLTEPAMHGTGAPRAWQNALWVLMAMVAAVLLLACVNIAHLLLARASSREREHSVRAAIGASRGRLIRQQLTESLLLAGLGGALGIGTAYALSETLLNLMVSDRAHSTLKVLPDAGLLTFNFGISIVAGILFGLAPAMRASRPRLLEGLKGTLATGLGRLATRKLLISAQIAVSVVLLMAAVLFTRTLSNFGNLNLGFRPDHLVEFGLDAAGYPPEQVFPFYDRVRERIAAIPGVEAVAVSRQRLVGGGGWGSGISVEGYVVKEGEQAPNRDAVSAGYFSAVGMPLVAGREFESADTASKVAIINETFARRHFAGQNPIGKRIDQTNRNPPAFTIIGVVRDAKYAHLRGRSPSFWYVPYGQLDPIRFHAFTLNVRTAANPESMIRSLREAVASIDKNVALFGVRTLEAQVNADLQVERLLATLSILFGGLAALLAAIGLFGVLAYSVARREREIGIRIALGASPYQASWAILREVVAYVTLGL